MWGFGACGADMWIDGCWCTCSDCWRAFVALIKWFKVLTIKVASSTSCFLTRVALNSDQAEWDKTQTNRLLKKQPICLRESVRPLSYCRGNYLPNNWLKTEPMSLASILPLGVNLLIKPGNKSAKPPAASCSDTPACWAICVNVPFWPKDLWIWSA